MLREGEDVPLKFAQDISSKTASDGDPVAFTLDEDLKVGGVVVAKAGSKAFGEVTNAKKSGMMGKAGELNIRLDYLKAGDTKIKLRGTKAKEGESGTTGAVVLTVLFGPIGLIKHGKNIDIKQGTAEGVRGRRCSSRSNLLNRYCEPETHVRESEMGIRHRRYDRSPQNMGLVSSIRGIFEKPSKVSVEPQAIVLMMRKPFYLGEDVLRELAGRAFGVPYDGSSPMHCVVAGRDLVMLKNGAVPDLHLSQVGSIPGHNRGRRRVRGRKPAGIGSTLLA